MKTLREKTEEIIANYTEEELQKMLSNQLFISIHPDGSTGKIEYGYSCDIDPEDIRGQMSDLLDNLEFGFFDDEPEYSIMADIINNDVLWEWGADATLLESYNEKIPLIYSIANYGYSENTKEDMSDDDWDIMTDRLDLNRRFQGKIYSSGGYNQESMTFCLDWDCINDPRQPLALNVWDIDELIETINDPDNNTLFWSADRGLIHGNEARTAALEWIDKHDITEQRQSNTNPAYWQDFTSKLGLHASYNESVFYTVNGDDYQALITVTTNE